MERWLFTFFIGAILSLFLPIVPDISQVFICVFIALFLCCFKPLRKYSGLFFGCAWLLYAGFFYQNIWQTNQMSTDDFAGETIDIKGRVANIPLIKMDDSYKGKSAKKTARFNFIIDEFEQKKLTEQINIRLRWDIKTSIDGVPIAINELQQGQRWQFKVRIKPAHGFANIGGFNYQAWLRQKDLHATGYVRSSVDNKLIDKQSSYRQTLYLQLTDLLGDLSSESELKHFMLALTFGERSKITKPQWQILQATGTQHLMAISGLHLGLIASGAFALILLFFRYFPFNIIAPEPISRWLVNKNTRIFALVFSSVVALLYAYLAGFSLPTLRALIMMLIFIGAKLLSVKLSLVRWLLLSVVSIILLSPFSVFSVSFWLSIYAVTLILLIIWRCRQLMLNNTDSRFIGIKAWFHSLVIVQLGLSLFMLPIAALLNHQLPLSAIFANIIAVPWMSFTAIPLCLLAVIVMPFSEASAIFLLDVSLLSLEFIWQWLTYLSSQQWLFIDISHESLIILFAITGLLFLSYFLSFSKKMVLIGSLIILLSIFSYKSYQQRNNSWRVNVLDVGQGLAVVIERNGQTILYDTGASYPSGFNMAESVVLPYLKYQGINNIDSLILSHADNDHAGGLAFIAKQAAQKKIAVSEIRSNVNAVENYNFSLKKTCLQGDDFTWQGLYFSVLWPVEIQENENNNSCVINISDGTHSVLLTGDISRKVEKKLLLNAEVVKKLKANVIIAPHHGSKTSSSSPFIEAVSPDAVVFSAGFLNRWHMPNSAVIKRYQQQNVANYSTAKQGMVRITVSGQRLEIESYREHINPYWFAN
jgi:competence protein ComEC